MATRKTTRTRPFSTTPILTSLITRRAHWLVVLPLLFMPHHIGDVLPVVVMVVLFAAVVALKIWLLTSHPGHRTFVQVLRSLHQDLPWFEAASITWMHDDQMADLRAALTRDDVSTHEIDGATVHSAERLAAQLEQEFGSRTFPADPIAKCLAILSKVGEDQQRAHVLLWTRADTMASADPEGFTRFVAAWTSAMHTTTPHVLLFLARPLPAQATHLAEPSDTEPRVATPPEARRPDPAYAPGNAWWRPRPGEMTS